jgi:nitrate reductase gamma subunit
MIKLNSQFFWVAGPYMVTLAFIVGMIWRYKYDRYGWTSRSSQLYENRLLRIGSPLFHGGILLALMGHIAGLVIPASLTERVGITEHAYHLVAVISGTISGVMVVLGMSILIWRRRTNFRVFSVTTPMDKLMYLVLGSVVALGMMNTVGVQLFGIGGYPEGYNYRETISVWFRSIAMFNPKPELMADAPISFKFHIIAAMLLIALTPVTRLVHIFSVPLGYVSRPYIVYRTRDGKVGASRAPERGWEPLSPRE